MIGFDLFGNETFWISFLLYTSYWKIYVNCKRLKNRIICSVYFYTMEKPKGVDFIILKHVRNERWNLKFYIYF